MLTLAASLPPAPGKYVNLVRAAEVVRVPQTILLESDLLAEWIEDYVAINAEIQRNLERIVATSAAFLNQHVADIHRLVHGMRWNQSAMSQFQRLAGSLRPKSPHGIAVRSAAAAEDTRKHSYAGLHKTFLGVRPEAQPLANAVLGVWQSYFAYGAIVERISAGSLDDGRRMNVILQPLVPARFAGVVFTASPLDMADGAYLEYVEGLGEALVSGDAEPRRVDYASSQTDATPCGRMSSAVFDAAFCLKEKFGADLDIEWAFDGDAVWILQIRPITTIGSEEACAAPTWAVADLFNARERDLAQFRPLPKFAEYFRTKRAPLFRFAREHAVGVGKARMVKANLGGLDEGHMRELLEELSSEEIVVDVSDRIRQIIVGRDELAECLRGLMRDPCRIYRVLLREFIRGQFGLITRSGDHGTALCEYTPDGLLALNRGSASTELVSLCRGAPAPAPFTAADVDELVSVTAAAQQAFGVVQLEWVLHDAELYLLDISALNEPAMPLHRGEGNSVISFGYAVGPVLRIGATAELAQLSDGPAISLTSIPDGARMGRTFGELLSMVRSCTRPPVVLVPRPYAALAPLLPHVAGFIFEQASSLCHLAILLREKNVPAIASEVLFQSVVDGSLVTIDARPKLPAA
jgi:phosphohistidine swiveling domain-containing protein